MIEQVLRYLLPDGADAPQRIALRPTGIFVGVLIVALAIAFGSDTISIIGRSVSVHTGIQMGDLPLTATTLSVAVPLLILGLAYLVFAARFRFIRFWSFSWFATHRTVGIGTELPAINLLENILEYFGVELPRQASQADNVEKEFVHHASHLLETMKLAAPETMTEAQKQEKSELQADLERNDRKEDAYKSWTKQSKDELIALATQLLDELERLTVYLQRKQLEPLNAQQPQTQPAPGAKSSPPPPAALNIQALVLRWSGAEHCRDLFERIRAASDKAPSAALEALAKEWATRSIKLGQTIAKIDQLILDKPFLPSSLQEPDAPKPRATALGLSLWRTSLGVGRKNLGEKPVSYYINASHRGQDSDAQGLEAGWLEQNERLREDVYRSLIYASLAAALVLVLGVAGPGLFRPWSLAVLVWPALCLVFLWRVVANLKSAQSSATDLCALESCLWQYAINGIGTPPKRLLVTQSGPAGRRKRRGELFWLGAAVAAGTLAITMSYWGLGGVGRWYSVPYARLSLPEKFLLTKDNVSTVVDLQSSFLPAAPRLRSADQLIGSIVPKGCPGPDQEREGTFSDVKIYDSSASYTQCDPVINWRGQTDDKQQVIALDVRMSPPGEIKPGDLVLPPPNVTYDNSKGMPKLPDLSLSAPNIDYASGKNSPTLPDLTLAPPSVKYNAVMPTLEPLIVRIPELKISTSTVSVTAGNIVATGETGDDIDCKTDGEASAGSVDQGNSGGTQGVSDGVAQVAKSGVGQATAEFNSGCQGEPYQRQARGTLWANFSAPPFRGISLYFLANCPQRSGKTKGLAAATSKHAARPCDTGSDPDGLNESLNGFLQVTPEGVKALVRSNPKARFVVIGHADTPGDTDFNLALSEDRVAYALTLFRDAGVEVDKISVRTFAAGGDFAWLPQEHGSNEPQQLNRRVDIYVFGK